MTVFLSSWPLWVSGSPVRFGSRNSLVLAVSVSSGSRGSFDSDGSFVLTFLVLLSGSTVSCGSSRYHGCSGSSGTFGNRACFGSHGFSGFRGSRGSPRLILVVLLVLCCRAWLGTSRTTFKDGTKTLHAKFYCVSINADLQFLFFTPAKSSLNNSCLESVFQLSVDSNFLIALLSH